MLLGPTGPVTSSLSCGGAATGAGVTDTGADGSGGGTGAGVTAFTFGGGEGALFPSSFAS